MTDPRIPLPYPDYDSRAFWDACRQHELRAQRCRQCGRFRWPPRGVCPGCHSWELDWPVLCGRGTIASFVVVHATTHPAFASKVPYVVAQVTLDGTGGKVTITSNVVDCPWQNVYVGMAVTAQFADVSPEISLPQFTPIVTETPTLR